MIPIDWSFITTPDKQGNGNVIINGKAYPLPVDAVNLIRYLEEATHRYVHLNSISAVAAKEYFDKYPSRRERSDAIDRDILTFQSCNNV